LRQEIGLGNAQELVEVELFWPASGLKQIVRGLELDHGYLVKEGEDLVRRLDLPRFQFQKGVHAGHQHGKLEKP
jgi:hypothetical protein